MVNTFGSGYGPSGYPGGGAGRVRPGCLLLTPLRWLSSLVVLAGFAVMAITAPWGGLWTLVRGSADAVASVEPGELDEVDLPEAGEWIIYAEGDVTVEDCPDDDDICRADFDEPEVVVADADGEPLELAASTLSVSDVGTESVSLWSFDVDEPGPVTVLVGTDTDIDRIAIARSPELELDSFRGVLIGGAIVAVGIVFRLAVSAVGSLLGR